MRLNRYIASSGLCSRREADRLIASGQVTVNGVGATLGQDASERDVVMVGTRRVRPIASDDHIYLAYHKPLGVTVTTDCRRRDNVIDALGYPERIFPVGRLDRDSTGLLLMTNDGSIVNRILRAQHGHEKEYRVIVDRPPSEEQLRTMARGIALDEATTLPCRIRRTGTQSYRIILKQGLNRQIRRMAAAVGLTVVALERIRIMHITLGSLPPGAYRKLTYKEVRDLFQLLDASS